jgi:hypothetical protein
MPGPTTGPRPGGCETLLYRTRGGKRREEKASLQDDRMCERFIVLIAVTVMIVAFSDVPTFNLVDNYRRFGGTYCVRVGGK